MKKKLIGIMIILAMTFSVVQPIQIEPTIESQALSFPYPVNESGIKKMYKKVKKGMTYKKVKKIFYRKADETHSKIIGTKKSKVRLWTWEHGTMLDSDFQLIVIEIGFNSKGKVTYKMYSD